MFETIHDFIMSNFSQGPRKKQRQFFFFFLKCIALLSLLGCQSLFYFPSKEVYFSPSPKKEDVFFESDLKDRIHAWYFPAVDPQHSLGTLLFFHGNSENVTSQFLMFQWLPSQGYNYLVFDYPGYGKSSGSPTPESTVMAGVAAARWVHQYKDQRPLIIYGHSLGGIVALKVVEKLKSEIPIRAIVAEASFSSYKKMAGSILGRRWWTWPYLPFTRFVVNDDWAPESVAHLSPIPILFIHGSEDHTVNIENTEKMYSEAHEPKELWIIPGGHHGDLFELRGGELRGQFLAYLAKTLTESSRGK